MTRRQALPPLTILILDFRPQYTLPGLTSFFLPPLSPIFIVVYDLALVEASLVCVQRLRQRLRLDYVACMYRVGGQV